MIQKWKKLGILVLSFLLIHFFKATVYAGWLWDVQEEPDDVDVRSTDEMAGEEFIAWVQDVVNWVLWLLWLIALIIVMWWGFLMVTAAGNEERYKKWFDILKQSSIWLVVIWVAWLIISLVMVVIGLGE